MPANPGSIVQELNKYFVKHNNPSKEQMNPEQQYLHNLQA